MKRAFAWMLVALVVFVLRCGAWVWSGLSRPFKGYDAAEQFVEIPQGAGPASIGKRLIDAGVVRDRLLFRVELARSRRRTAASGRRYRFDRPMTVGEVIAKLARGDVYLRAHHLP